MNAGNTRGVWNIVRRRPQVLSVIAEDLTHRLAHTYSRNHRDGGSAVPEQITVVVTDV